MRLPRMTTRRWMVAVAVVGLLMGGISSYRIRRRYSEFIGRVRHHELLEAAYKEQGRHVADFSRSSSVIMEDLKDDPGSGRLKALRNSILQNAASFSQRTEYHADMARKYRHAARYPWLPVEPDPPEPK